MFFGGIFLLISFYSLLGSFGVSWILSGLCCVLIGIIYGHRSFFWAVCGVGVGLLSRHMFTLHTYATPPGELFRGKIVSQVKPDQYEIDMGTTTYLIKSNKKLSAGTIVDVLPAYYVVSQQKKMSLWKIHLHGLFSRDFSYEIRLYMKGYGGYIIAKDVEVVDHTISMRGKIIDSIDNHFPNIKHAGLLQGMILGGRAGISDGNYQKFIQSGLVHLVAVSGSNIALVALCVGGCFFFVPIVWRRWLIIGSIVGYVILCGADSSLMRAACVGVLILYGAVFGKRIHTKRLLRYALTLLLIINPYLLRYDVGLLLSVSSVLGIFGVMRVAPKQKLYRHIYTYMMIPLSAGIVTLPIVYLFIGTAWLQGLIANLVVGRSVGATLLLSSLSIVTGWQFLANLSQIGLDFIYMISDIFSRRGVSLSGGNIFQTTTILVCVIVVLWCLLIDFHNGPRQQVAHN